MQLHFKTYCNKNNLQSVRDFLRKSLNENGITDSDAYMTVLAVDEICANLMIHSNCCNDKMEINLNLAFLHNQLKIIISDSGTAFNYENHTDKSLVSLIEERRKGGLGLMLVKKIMDEVSYESVSGRNFWVLCKKIH
jgi:serine/threonine-protein kinase RsbW